MKLTIPNKHKTISQHFLIQTLWSIPPSTETLHSGHSCNDNYFKFCPKIHLSFKAPQKRDPRYLFHWSFCSGSHYQRGGEVLEQAKLTHWDGPPSEKAKRLRRRSQIHYTQTALKTVYIFYYSPRAFYFF